MTIAPQPAPTATAARWPRSRAAAQPPVLGRPEFPALPAAADIRVREPLQTLFDPRSVAIVGASANRQKWGYWLARGALAGLDRRQVYLVNRRGAVVLGSRSWPSLADLPESPELVVVATPPGHVRLEVEQGLQAGARCFVVITTGVGDPASVRDELELAELVRSRGARLLGPNCMGVVDHAATLQLCWGAVPGRPGGAGVAKRQPRPGDRAAAGPGRTGPVSAGIPRQPARHRRGRGAAGPDRARADASNRGVRRGFPRRPPAGAGACLARAAGSPFFCSQWAAALRQVVQPSRTPGRS